MSKYSLFTFDALYNPHLEISKFLKECTVVYLSLATLWIGGVWMRRTMLVKIRARVLPSCILFLSTIESDGYLSENRMNFSKNGTTDEYDGVFTGAGLPDVMGEKNC